MPKKRTPIEIHKARGTYRPARHTPPVTASSDSGVPECPAWLGDDAKAVWADLAPRLDARRILTQADSYGLQVLCTTFAEWRQLCQDLVAEGSTYECRTEAGAVMRRPNPKMAMRADCQRRLVALLGEFGMSPAARSKAATVAAPASENRFAGLGSAS
jgi:P27 family predicted phage terminase small subunit